MKLLDILKEVSGPIKLTDPRYDVVDAQVSSQIRNNPPKSMEALLDIVALICAKNSAKYDGYLEWLKIKNGRG